VLGTGVGLDRSPVQVLREMGRLGVGGNKKRGRFERPVEKARVEGDPAPEPGKHR
jgi:hypothetical protein